MVLFSCWIHEHVKRNKSSRLWCDAEVLSRTPVSSTPAERRRRGAIVISSIKLITESIVQDHEQSTKYSNTNTIQPSSLLPPSTLSIHPLTHDHLIPRHTTHNNEPELKEMSHGPHAPSTPIALIPPAIPNRIRHPTNTPRGPKARTHDRI